MGLAARNSSLLFARSASWVEEFYDYCQGETDLIPEEFVRGMADVLELDEGEKLAFAWAIMWGRVSSGEPPTA